MRMVRTMRMRRRMRTRRRGSLPLSLSLYLFLYLSLFTSFSTSLSPSSTSVLYRASGRCRALRTAPLSPPTALVGSQTRPHSRDAGLRRALALAWSRVALCSSSTSVLYCASGRCRALCTAQLSLPTASVGSQTRPHSRDAGLCRAPALAWSRVVLCSSSTSVLYCATAPRS